MLYQIFLGLVLEKALEFNSTKIPFVANQAVFLNKEDTVQKLTEVAQVMNENSDHKFLIVGTTAAWGDLDSSESLAAARANAVSDLLINSLQVSADQLITVGLNYEEDGEWFTRAADIAADGSFVETEGAKNRRVIILDSNDETAQKIIASSK